MPPSACLAHPTGAWAEELVQNLLAMVHKMWIAHNDVAHAIDEKGCNIKDVLAMDTDIEEQFMLGYEDLMRRNFHLINIGRSAIDRRSAGKQWVWLHSI